MYDSTKPYTKKILELVRTTWKDNEVPPSSTDGIGTKGFYHWQQKTLRSAALDALAMNLNDMAVLRARTTYLHDHILIPEDDEKSILEIVKTLAEECRKRDIVMSSGETSIHDNLNGLDISVNVTGEYIGERRENKFKECDYLVGIKSNGLHSNGFTKVRELFGDEFRKEFTDPTFIYYDAILDLIKRFDINGMVHITGGAYTKLKPFLNENDAIILKEYDFFSQDIFNELYKRGISDEKMYKTFNCGIGFILSVRDNLEGIVSRLNDFGFDAKKIGIVYPGTGKVRIDSKFSQEKVIL
jgi:phosphoribosylformylglycinamidine cyclo-ligase|tara:strand:- start:165 stop:1061 length:897 start_codon:yes stop_codon:yes gene_type:complete